MMRYARWILFGGTLLLGISRVLHAQAAGQRVRITAADYRLSQAEGRVLSATQDSLVVEFSWIQSVHFRQVTAFDTIALSRNTLDRVEVSLAHGRRTGRGAALGFGVAALAGI